MFIPHESAEISVAQQLLSNALKVASLNPSYHGALRKIFKNISHSEDIPCIFDAQLNLLSLKLRNGNGKEKKKND